MEINGYSLIEEIKHDGFSVLYKANKIGDDLVPGKLTYLIKMYHSDVDSEVIENEIRISQVIEETCPKSIIIPILEKFVRNGQVYAVLQFKKNGLFLSQIIELLEQEFGEGNIPLMIIVDIIRKILYALDTFHHYCCGNDEMGFLHLDLNPGNIFFESANVSEREWGTVKFIDFGSCVDIEHKDRMMKDRQWFCLSYGYSAPEIVEQIDSQISESSDLYSICACMLRMYFGSRYHTLDEQQFSEKLMNHNKVISTMFEVVINNASCSPSYYRYETAKQMTDDLNDLAQCIAYDASGEYFQLLFKCYEQSIPVEYVKTSAWGPLNISNYRRAINQLQSMLVKDYVCYSMCCYIFEALYFIGHQYLVENNADHISLLNSGLACYNYMGNSRMCLKLYEEVVKYQECMTIEAYITVQLRYAVSLADCCKYNDALQIASGLISGLESFINKAFVNKPVRLKELGRAYSAAGTYRAFLEQENVLDYYKKALKEFEGDPGNCRITYSKILHYAVQIKDQHLYETLMESIIGRSGLSLIDQFRLLRDKAGSDYDLFIYMKGLHAFYMDKIDGTLMEEIHRYLNQMKDVKKEHPIQLIYKYCAMIFKEMGNEPLAQEYFRLSVLCIEAGRKAGDMNIYTLMSYQTRWIENTLFERFSENEKLLEDILNRTNHPFWIDLHDRIENEKTLEFLLKHEYC